MKIKDLIAINLHTNKRASEEKVRDFQLFYSSKMDNNKYSTGIFAETFINKITKQFVIVFDAPSIKNPSQGNLLSDYTDMQKIWNGIMPLQFTNGAEPFIKESLLHFERDFGAASHEYQIITTGFSNGAVLSDLGAVYLSTYKQFKMPVISVNFNNHGAQKLIEKMKAVDANNEYDLAKVKFVQFMENKTNANCNYAQQNGSIINFSSECNAEHITCKVANFLHYITLSKPACGLSFNDYSLLEQIPSAEVFKMENNFFDLVGEGERSDYLSELVDANNHCQLN